ncbi:MAG: ADOP family duplicated permease [Gemmatimonadales bacterium]
MSWLGRLLRRGRLERELDRELQFHLDEHARRLMDGGVPAREARRQARLALGGVEQVKEATRDVRGTRWLEDWWADTRYAIRGMRRAPGFTAAAVLTLAVGIGANVGVFSVVDALLLRPLPVSRPAELFGLRRAGRLDGSRAMRFSAGELDRLRGALPDSAALVGFTPRFRLYLTSGDLPESIVGQLVTGDWFSLLGVRPAAGRLFGPAEARGTASAPVAVVSYGYWNSRLGRRPDVIGSTVRVNGAAVTILGVAQEGFGGISPGEPADLWLPYGLQPAVRYLGNASADDADFQQPWIPQPGIRWLSLLARLPADTRAAETSRLAAEFRALTEDRAAAADSGTAGLLRREQLDLTAAEHGLSELQGQLGGPLLALMASVALVLLIACANLASLLLARGAARSQELAVRVSLGASTTRLVRQVLTEAVVLALAGGAAALAVARLGAQALLSAASQSPGPIPVALPFDARLLGFALGASLVTGLLFGLAPAWRVARAGPFDEFRGAGRVAGNRRPDRLPMGRILVAGQVALSLVLVVLAGLFSRTFRNLTSVDPGFDRERVIAARIDPRAGGYAGPDAAALNQRLLEAVRAVPGVRFASMSAYSLGSGSAMTSGFEVPGQVRSPDFDADAQTNYVTADYFDVTGIPILSGRGIAVTDVGDGVKAAVLSVGAARHFFGTDQVIGRRFGYDETANMEIVGVVPDVRINSLAEAAPRMVYLAAAQEPQVTLSSIEARVDGPGAAAVGAVRAAIASVDRALPVREVVTVDELLGRQLTQRRMAADMAGLFGLLALLLAAVGLYGVLAYSVARRTNEIGIRIALGAGAGEVRWLVLRDSLGIVVTGLVAGSLLALGAASLARSLLFGVSPGDPVVLGLGAGTMLAVGFAAGMIPAWRASRVAPVEALRSD